MHARHEEGMDERVDGEDGGKRQNTERQGKAIHT